METARKHENEKFLVITLKHVSGLKVSVNGPRIPKLWAIPHENGHKTEKLRVSIHISQHVTSHTIHANPPGTQKLWAITHKNGQKTRKRHVSGHISKICNESYQPCKSAWKPKYMGNNSRELPENTKKMTF